MTIAGIGLAFLFLVVFVTVEERRAALLAATVLLMAATVVPRVLVVVATSPENLRGMAHSDLVITTYAAAIAVVALGLVLRGESLTIPRAWLLLGILLPCLAWMEWGIETRVWSGILHLYIAFLAWPIGLFVARCLADSEGVRSRFMLLLLVILGGQALLGVLQLNNMFPEAIAAGTGPLEEGSSRITGTLGTAPNLSKIAFFFLLLGLQSTGSARQGNRLLGYLVVAAAIALTALTVSRANLLACAATLAVWIILAPRRLTLGQRIVAVTMSGGVLAVMAGPTIRRFIDDPSGATRPELMAGAMEALGQFWVLGAGVNSYVATLSDSVPIVAATGQPVHNTLLYALIELGVLLALLLFWPFLAHLRRSISRFQTSLEARIVVSALPGIAAIAWTGWGLLSTFVLPTFIFVTAILSRSIDSPGTGEVSR